MSLIVSPRSVLAFPRVFMPLCALLCVLVPRCAVASKPNVIPGGMQQIADFSNRQDVQDMAAFALQQHNEKEGTDLHLVRVDAASQQVVAGILFHFTITACSPSARHTAQYQAVVWERAWQNFRALHSFADVPGSQRAAFPAELQAAAAAAAAGDGAGAAGEGGEGERGAADDAAGRNGGEEQGLGAAAAAAGEASEAAEKQGTCSNVLGEDHSSSSHQSAPSAAVLEAAERATSALQQRSNSLFPYRLKEVVSALATPAEAATPPHETTMYHLTLRLHREVPPHVQQQQEGVAGPLPDELYEVVMFHSPNGQWSLHKAVALQ